MASCSLNDSTFASVASVRASVAHRATHHATYQDVCHAADEHPRHHVPAHVITPGPCYWAWKDGTMLRVPFPRRPARRDDPCSRSSPRATAAEEKQETKEPTRSCPRRKPGRPLRQDRQRLVACVVIGQIASALHTWSAPTIARNASSPVPCRPHAPTSRRANTNPSAPATQHPNTVAPKFALRQLRRSVLQQAHRLVVERRVRGQPAR